MKLLIYDVETANANRSSICQVGWIMLNNDEIVDSDCSLINPHEEFDVRNVKTHGITAKEVENAPSFSEYFAFRLAELFESCLILAHNAIFDIMATTEALEKAGNEMPSILFVDTITVARALAESRDYKLITLANSIGYKFDAHNALNDCQAVLAVLNHIRDSLHFDDIISMIIKSRAPIRENESKLSTPKKLELSSTSSAFSYSHEHFSGIIKTVDEKLKDLRFCLTGECEAHQREDVEREIAMHGGICTTAPSRKTDFLVVGIYGELGTEYVSSKQKKAMELNAAGAHIKIISFEELYALIGADS